MDREGIYRSKKNLYAGQQTVKIPTPTQQVMVMDREEIYRSITPMYSRATCNC